MKVTEFKKACLAGAVLSAAFLHAGAARTVSEGSLLRMGPMCIAPVIDGSISSDEARASSAQYGAISATTGLMSKRYAAFQFGYTDKGFYFASRTSLPNAPQTLVAEDAVTFSLLPPGAGKPLEFRLCLADGKGNLPEGSSSAVKPLVGVSDYGVLCTEAEIFVPYSAVGLKRPADGGKWGLQMTVDFSSVRETARWHNPAVADEMGSFIPDASCPVPGIANFYMLEQYRESGNYCFAFVFDNFSGKDAMLRSKTLFHRGIGLAKLDSNPEKDVDIQHVPFQDLDKVTLPAAKNTEIVHKEWVIWPGSVSILDIDLSSDGKDFFRRKIRWDVAVGESWSDGKGLPFIRSAFFPTSGNRLRVCWDFNKIADVVRADLRVKGRKSGKVFFETALDVGKRNGVIDTHLPELPLDDYIVRFSVTDGKGEKYKHDGSFRVAKFPWQNARIGEERVVVPPYVPIVAKGDETRFLQTAYRSSGVFWDRVDALGENILAAPVELRMNGKAFPVSSQRIVSADKDRVVREVVGEKDGIRLVATQTYDYDGFCWVRLKFDVLSSVTVNSLQVVMPLKNEIARLFGVLNRSDKRSGPAPDFTLPSREGEVWNSAENTQLKGILRSFPAPIQPYVWFGGPFKGFCWLMESVRDMSLEKTVPAQRIVRANGAATLTCDLVNVPVEWTGEKVFEMGFQPTPTRPKDPAHGVFASRMYRYNTPTNAVVYQHGFPFMLHPIHTPFGTFPGNDTSLMDWARSQKKRDRGAYLAKLKEYIATHEDWFAKSRVSSASAYYTAAVNHDRQMGIEISPCYLNPMLITSFWPEWEMYKSEWYPEEWTHDNYFNEYMAYTSKTRIDKLMWDVKLALDLGFDGIYYDCFRSCGGRSLANPDVYIRKNGSVQGALTNVRAWREIMKRTATACYVRGKMYNGRPLVENHDTNGHIVPIMSFAMGGLSTERGSAGGEFPIRFPEGYTLAEITGGQTGKGTRYIVSTKKGDTAQQERELRSLMGFMCAYGMFSICDQNIIPRAWFDKAWNTVFDFGWGRPGVKQHFYWDGKPQPVTHDGRDVRVTVAEKSDAALLMFGNLGDAAKVRFDVSGLGFGKVRMTDIDTGAVIDSPVIDIVRHGYRMIRVDKEK